MKFGYNSKQIMFGLTFGFLMVTGTYNAIVINSESVITGTDIRFAKRLDEVYGVVVSNRDVANSMHWQKLSVQQAAVYREQIKVDKIAQSSGSSDSAPAEVAAQAAVQEELNLNLTAVINPQKWPTGVTSGFSGSLSTNQGVIESLTISLPSGENISVSFSEMTGNVFEYDYEGELYSGMMYQENQNSYVVKLTTGPEHLKLAGTHLTFTGEASLEETQQQEDNQRMLAENNEAEAGVQMEQAPQDENAQQNQEMAQADGSQIEGYQQPEMISAESAEANDIYAQEQGQLEHSPEQAQGFNFEQSQAAM